MVTWYEIFIFTKEDIFLFLRHLSVSLSACKVTGKVMDGV